MPANTDYEINPQLTALAIAYKNDAFIADLICPYVPVMSDPFKWTQFTVEDSYRVENDAIGRVSFANEVDESSLLRTAACFDYGFDRLIPLRDGMQPYPPGFNPEARATELLAQKVLLNRERRVATLFTTLTNYDADKRTTLLGTQQFSDYVNSDPVNIILRALDAPLERPNTGIIPRDVFTVLRGHPKIINAIFGQAGVTNGVVSEEQIANLFGLDKILVPNSRANNANKGQPSAISRVWGKNMCFIANNPTSDLIGGGVTFALTGRFGNRVVRTMDEPRMGLYGSKRIRFGESTAELIVAPSSGYFFQNAIA